MRQKVSVDSILTGLFAVMLFLLLFYHTIKEFYPELDPFLMTFCQLVGLVLAILLIFCFIGLALLVIRRLYRRLYHRLYHR